MTRIPVRTSTGVGTVPVLVPDPVLDLDPAGTVLGSGTESVLDLVPVGTGTSCAGGSAPLLSRIRSLSHMVLERER